jgi:hypothetical protein
MIWNAWPGSIDHVIHNIQVRIGREQSGERLRCLDLVRSMLN